MWPGLNPTSSVSEATAAVGAVLTIPRVAFLAGGAGLLGHRAVKERPAAFSAPRRLVVADGTTGLAGL
jgi:hypothetical protein